MAQPMIPIKKSDGTVDYVTLAQFQAMQTQTSSQAATDQREPQTNEMAAWQGDDNQGDSLVTKEKTSSPPVNKPVETPRSHEEAMSDWHGDKSPVAHPKDKIKNEDSGNEATKTAHTTSKTDDDTEMPQLAVQKVEGLLESGSAVLEEQKQTVEPEPQEIKEDVDVSSKDNVSVLEATSTEQSEIDRVKKEKKDDLQEQDMSLPIEQTLQDSSKSTWSKEDHSSLLEEPVPQGEGTAPIIDRSKDVDAVLQAVTSKTSVTHKDKLAPIIQSRLKDVRTRSQVIQVLQKSVEQGGLGLDPEQANDMAATIDNAIIALDSPEQTEPMDSVSPRSDNPAKAAIDRLIKADQAVQPYHLQLSAMKAKKDRVLQDVSKSATQPTAEQRRTMGPVDELRAMSLIDFRRLAPQAMGAASIIEAKFANLKNESFLQFLEGVQAWHNSDVFQQYLALVREAIATGQSLDQVLAVGEMTMDDINAIIHINDTILI